MNEARTNLLIDSLSSNSEDIPDLQLIPPTKAKKKRLSKIKSRFSNPALMMGGRVMTKGGGAPSKCWSCSLVLLLLSLIIGLAILATFTIKLQSRFEEFKNSTISGQTNPLALFALEKRVNEHDEQMSECCRHRGVSKPPSQTQNIPVSQVLNDRLDAISLHVKAIQIMLNDTVLRRLDTLENRFNNLSIPNRNIDKTTGALPDTSDLQNQLDVLRNISSKSSQNLAQVISSLEDNLAILKSNLSDCCSARPGDTLSTPGPKFLQNFTDKPLLPRKQNQNYDNVDPDLNSEKSANPILNVDADELPATQDPKLRRRPPIEINEGTYLNHDNDIIT